MNFIISGRNIDITPGLRQAVEQKLGKLEKYFTPETDIIVTLSVEKGRQKIEVTIPVKGNIIRSEQESRADMISVSNLLNPILRQQSQTRLRSSVPNVSASNQCSRRMPAFRWNFSDITSTYSAMLRQTKSMSYIRERMEPTV